jgi:predicted ATPase
MRARVSVVNLNTAGQVIVPSENVTLIVGPNNVGKSAVLSGIQQDITFEINQPLNTAGQPVSSTAVTIPQNEEYAAALTKRARLYEAGTYPQGTFYEPTYIFQSGPSLSQSYLKTALQRSNRFGQLASVILSYMGPEGRGGVLNPQQVPDLMMSTGRSPIQLLWEDRALEATLDEYMNRAFGRRLLVNRHAGVNIYLQIGQVSAPEPKIGERSPYLEQAMKLPQLATQGSGMQAFMGTVLTLAAGSFDIVLLDEPEAFLHPPQARLLGEVVAEMSKDGGPQVIVATHSDDFVQGVINSSRADADVTVVRITRPSEAENRVAQVKPEAIKDLYRDPLLRYSNIMNGIFYKGAVICESEADCTYYSATLAYVEETHKLGASDLLFTQCGGKDRLQRAYEALDAAAVPTAVVADIDLLADKGKFKSLFEAMGGDFDAIDAKYNTLEASVKNHKVEPTRNKTRVEVAAILDGSDEVHFSKDELGRLSDLIRSESGWKQVKRKGTGAIDNGDPTAAFNSIVSAGREQGLFLVELGELERFHADVAGNKQQWLRRVLEGELFKASEEAQAFVRAIREFIAAHQ